jgi:ABC-type bacteriocin/lantibiotic exporter with double-glycine peptidase domain
MIKYLKYLKYLKKIVFPLTLLIFGVIISALANISIPFIYKIIYDELVQTSDKGILLLVIVCILSIFIVSALTNFLTENLSSHIRGKLVAIIRNDISSEILSYNYVFFKMHDIGSILQRLVPEIETISTTILSIFKSFGFVLQLSMILILMLYFNLVLFILCFVALLVYILWHGFVKQPIEVYTSKLHQAEGELFTFFAEQIANVKTIKLFNCYSRSLDYLEKRLQGIKIYSLLNVFCRSLLSVSTKILDITILVILIFSFFQITNGKMTVGFYLLFSMILSQLLAPVNALIELGNHLQSGNVAIKRIDEIRTGEFEASGKIKCGHENYGIEFNHIEFRYDQSKKILDNISFKINPGSFVAFVGGSGSGKSSIIQLLVRLYEPTAGYIYLDNNPVKNYEINSLREQVNVLSQDYFLFNDTIVANIDPRGCCNEKEIKDILNIADLLNFSERLDYRIGDGGWKLSGGERQRLSIARLLTKNPRIIVLDEATSNLDPKTERIIMNNILQLRNNKPGLIIIMITHRVQHLSQVDKIYFVDNGMIVDQGSHDELKSRNERYVNVLNTMIKN